MLGFLLESTLRTGAWVVGQGINGVNYMIYGTPEDKVIKKLESLENQISVMSKIDSSESADKRYYWLQKKISGFNRNSWIVISNQKVLLNTVNKSQALRAIADFQQDNQFNEVDEFKCLLIQVGQENNCFYI